LCEDLAVGQPVGDGVADLIFGYAPVVGVLGCEPLSDQGALDLLRRPPQELFEAVFEPDGPVPIFLANPVGMRCGEGHVARLHPAR
jgi:hypothetical protein